VAGREAARLGHGGIKQIAEITGLHPETIRRATNRDELRGRPTEQVRLPGGGRPRRKRSTLMRARRCVDPETAAIRVG
jgi:hypothetical protein